MKQNRDLDSRIKLEIIILDLKVNMLKRKENTSTNTCYTKQNVTIHSE
jgi:hypothetical protein